MKNKFILSDYIENALDLAEFELLEDGSFCGKIPKCKGVVVFGETLNETYHLLQSTLEEWVLLGLRLGHEFPIINDVNLNISTSNLEYESLQA
jgi:predicted RNase H-like HicB family nuclease